MQRPPPVRHGSPLHMHLLPRRGKELRRSAARVLPPDDLGPADRGGGSVGARRRGRRARRRHSRAPGGGRAACDLHSALAPGVRRARRARDVRLGGGRDRSRVQSGPLRHGLRTYDLRRPALLALPRRHNVVCAESVSRSLGHAQCRRERGRRWQRDRRADRGSRLSGRRKPRHRPHERSTVRKLHDGFHRAPARKHERGRLRAPGRPSGGRYLQRGCDDHRGRVPRRFRGQGSDRLRRAVQPLPNLAKTASDH